MKLLKIARKSSDLSFRLLLGEYTEDDLPPGLIPKDPEGGAKTRTATEESTSCAEDFEAVELNETEKNQEEMIINVKPWLKSAYAKTR